MQLCKLTLRYRGGQTRDGWFSNILTTKKLHISRASTSVCKEHYYKRNIFRCTGSCFCSGISHQIQGF